MAFPTLEKPGPIFFLAGPIRGGGDWQHQMCLELQNLCADCIIACPCRWYDWPGGHPLARYFINAPDGGLGDGRQLGWERHYIEQAAMGMFAGCVIFYLPKQREPRAPKDGPYAQDTYGELGEWRGRMMGDPFIYLVVGAEPDFPGLDGIKRNFSLALNADFPIHGTMEETARAALRRAYEH